MVVVVGDRRGWYILTYDVTDLSCGVTRKGTHYVIWGPQVVLLDKA